MLQKKVHKFEFAAFHITKIENFLFIFHSKYLRLVNLIVQKKFKILIYSLSLMKNSLLK